MGCKCRNKVVQVAKTIVKETKIAATVANITISNIMKKIYGNKKGKTMGCKCKDTAKKAVKTIVNETKIVATVANVTISDIMKKIYGGKK